MAFCSILGSALASNFNESVPRPRAEAELPDVTNNDCYISGLNVLQFVNLT
jgi:hypothetical protein